MAEGEGYREQGRDALRVLFCFGVQAGFFEEEPGNLPPIIEAIKNAFRDLTGRFGLTVLGTLDDDELVVGPSVAFPWTFYILADAPDLDAVTAVCNIIREAEVGPARLWKYLRVEARVGRQLFFGND